MIWIILIVVLGIILFSFLSSLNKDNDDLQGIELYHKFSLIVSFINNKAFNGNGSITSISKREFNLYEDGQNQIIKFQYNTGHLAITWKYKYFQKEIVHQKQFNNVRNLSLFEQQNIAEQMIDEMDIVILNHKNNVIGGI
jgi:hypothetical protein